MRTFVYSFEELTAGETIEMGGKKVTEYIKDMFEKYFVKDKTDSKNTSQNDTQNNIQNNQISQSEINNYVDNFIDTNQNKNNHLSCCVGGTLHSAGHADPFSHFPGSGLFRI